LSPAPLASSMTAMTKDHRIRITMTGSPRMLFSSLPASQKMLPRLRMSRLLLAQGEDRQQGQDRTEGGKAQQVARQFGQAKPLGEGADADPHVPRRRPERADEMRHASSEETGVV